MKRLAGAVTAAAVLVAGPAWADDELAAEGKLAPQFALPAYNPQPQGPNLIGLRQFVGADAQDKDTKLLVLSFMASFCGPCKKEMPYLQTLQDRYREHGLRVVMVSIDTEADGQKKIGELIAANNVSFPVLKDRFNIVAHRWLGNESPLPSLFFVKPDGTVSVVHRGYNDETSKALVSEVESALGVHLSPAMAKKAAPSRADAPGAKKPAATAVKDVP